MLICPGCGRQVPVPDRPQWQRKYCSRACANWVRRHDTLRPVTRRCQRCDVDISDRNITAKFCSETCSQRTHHGFVDKIEIDCPECRTKFLPKSSRHQYCTKKCSKAVYLRRFRMENPNWHSEWRRHGKGAAADQRRRVRLAGARTEKFTPLEIYERDRWRCGLCRKPVSKSRRWPDPLSASIDHLVPIARGGDHVRTNVQLAHLNCNVRKNIRGGGEQLMLFG